MDESTIAVVNEVWPWFYNNKLCMNSISQPITH